jgi:5'-methylthioinosine phosphorylase
MSELAIIGGTGLTALGDLEIVRKQVMHTPYGPPSGPVTHGIFGGKPVIFLPRHGYGHTIPPHQINYRANLWSLKYLGVKTVIAIAAVGGIRNDLEPAELVIPHQLIDYTWSRHHTLFEGGESRSAVVHIDFTEPYCEKLRQLLLHAADQAGLRVHARGVYGATQGPRLETAAEVDRLERDGCDLVGMTGMPEAALARELGLCYATCAVIANKAAGRGPAEITLEDIETNLAAGITKVRLLLEHAIPLI